MSWLYVHECTHVRGSCLKFTLLEIHNQSFETTALEYRSAEILTFNSIYLYHFWNSYFIEVWKWIEKWIPETIKKLVQGYKECWWLSWYQNPGLLIFSLILILLNSVASKNVTFRNFLPINSVIKEGWQKHPQGFLCFCNKFCQLFLKEKIPSWKNLKPIFPKDYFAISGCGLTLMAPFFPLFRAEWEFKLWFLSVMEAQKAHVFSRAITSLKFRQSGLL